MNLLAARSEVLEEELKGRDSPNRQKYYGPLATKKAREDWKRDKKEPLGEDSEILERRWDIKRPRSVRSPLGSPEGSETGSAPVRKKVND